MDFLSVVNFQLQDIVNGHESQLGETRLRTIAKATALTAQLSRFVETNVEPKSNYELVTALPQANA